MTEERPVSDGGPDRPADRTDAGGDHGSCGSRGSGGDNESAYELLQRGRGLMRRRHHAQAVIVLGRAAAIEPGRGSILEALGRACFISGQFERARETFEALLEVDPSSHYGQYALGQSLRRLGRDREALTHLRLAAALEPASTLYRGALARARPPADGAPPA